MANDLFFVACTPRSGSTMLIRILDSHSKIAAPGEIPLPAFFADAKREPQQRAEEQYRRVCAHYGVDRAEAAANPEILFRAIRESEGKPVLVVKFPGHATLLGELDRAHPGARFIHLVRDARSIVLSQMFVDRPAQGLRLWHRAHASILEFLEAVTPERRFRLRYEDVVLHPEEWVGRLVEFMALAFEPGMIDYGKFSHSAGAIARGRPAAEKDLHEELRRGTVSVEVLRDRQKFTREAVALYGSDPELVALNRRFGYDLPESAEATVSGEAALPSGVAGRAPSTAELRHAFVFVCRAGELETQALLLAASLHRHARWTDELVAAVPEPADGRGAPTPETLDALRGLGVRIVPIRDEVGGGDPDAGKVSCLGIETSADRLVLLDGDVLCMRRLGRDDVFRAPFCGAATGPPPAIAALDWGRAYACAGAAPPGEGESPPAWFGGGLLAVDPMAGFGRAWLECRRAIGADPHVVPDRRLLDEVAIPVALAKLGIPPARLPDGFIADRVTGVSAEEPPAFLRYGDPTSLCGDVAARTLVQGLARRHRALERRIAADMSWRPILEPRSEEELWSLLAAREDELERTRGALRMAERRIEGMRASKFWKLRGAWMRLKGLIVARPTSGAAPFRGTEPPAPARRGPSPWARGPEGGPRGTGRLAPARAARAAIFGAMKWHARPVPVAPTAPPAEAANLCCVFVIGCARSGTTWTKTLLGQHPRVATAMSETQLFADYLRPLLRVWDTHKGTNGKRVFLADVLSDDEFFDGCRRFAEAVLLRIAASKPEAKVVVEKTPGHIWDWRTIDRLFPDARFIHVVRDPRDVVASSRSAARSWAPRIPGGPVSGAQSWVATLIEGRRLAEAVGDRYRVVRYERLATHGADELASIFAWVGLAADRSLCEKLAARCTFEAMSGGESGSAKFYRKGIAGGWREDLARRQVRLVEAVAGDLMDELGYERVLPRVRRTPLRVRLRWLLRGLFGTSVDGRTGGLVARLVNRL